MADTEPAARQRAPDEPAGCGRARGDRGALAVELVAGFAIWIVVILYLVQFALWWHAKATVDTAAQQAAYAAKLAGATPTAGYDAANAILSQTGHLSAVTVTVSSGADTVVVDVRGSAPALTPFGARQVAARAEAPLERFVPRTERP
jgi:Flp pilus assembly protein TadG